ncbi:Flavin reductase [Paraburkholderia unamae]|uniref:NADPH-dependent FMN reductase n=1 Tax=Paraburkholderia unamae TaxID=219649 RepID=UPI001CB2AA9E|nr:NAD(P)H-dependent oxidoreductase [Paraburkholderia unamae]CAG9246055.1 Flavin reductase [Paraburkholderia unamae]
MNDTTNAAHPGLISERRASTSAPRDQPLIVGIGGTTRPGSTSETALRLTLQAARQFGAQTELFAGTSINLPVFDPGSPERHPHATRMIDALRRADGIIISSPGYHGSVSGMVKNALDYVEDLRGDRRPYFEGRSVGTIVCAEGPQALGSTLTTLRAIVHCLRGWNTPYGATFNVSDRPFVDGNARDENVMRQLELLAHQTVQWATLSRLAA